MRSLDEIINLELGGMSYHKSEKRNPKRDEAQVLERV